MYGYLNRTEPLLLASQIFSFVAKNLVSEAAMKYSLTEFANLESFWFQRDWNRSFWCFSCPTAYDTTPKGI